MNLEKTVIQLAHTLNSKTHWVYRRTHRKNKQISYVVFSKIKMGQNPPKVLNEGTVYDFSLVEDIEQEKLALGFFEEGPQLAEVKAPVKRARKTTKK